jgi:C_GCAxxG_C_C family probable redox protein
MSQADWSLVEARVCDLMDRGFHCSESFLLCVGEYLLGEIDPHSRRMATGFAGGIGCTFHEVCGALSGAIMLLGLVHGRITPEQDDSQCMQLVAKYRELFEQHFGTTNCQQLRDMGFGSGGTRPCQELVNESIRLFQTVITHVDTIRPNNNFNEI